MNLNTFKEILFEKAKEAGFENSEIYVTNSESLEISIYQQEVESYNLDKSFGLSFRGIINGKIGYSHTRILDETSVDTWPPCPAPTTSSAWPSTTPPTLSRPRRPLPRLYVIRRRARGYSW